MSDAQSTILSLPYLQPAQAQKHVTHNAALELLDVAVQSAVGDRDRSAPPAAPATGDRHIVAAGASGAWAGQEGRIALWDGADWRFFAALPGWRVHVQAENRIVVFDGSAWAPLPLADLDGVGIGTAPDATNRLAVSSPAVLFSHAGDDHRLILNKAGAGDTASLLFQTGWSGRAEIGTAGADRLAVKLSADGASWVTGLEFDPGTGQAQFPNGAEIDAALTGAAVQQAPGDITPGRLMRADYGYGPGNLLGTVSLSGGQPAGAVIERGSNANGEYLRLADGTQICTHTLSLGYYSGSTLSGSWSFPASFASTTGLVVAATKNMTASSLTPGRDQLAGFDTNAPSTSSVDFRQARIAGMTNFGSSDMLVIGALAIGRWG